MLLGMPLAIQIWLYECRSNVPRNVYSKVDSQIPRLLNSLTNSPRPRYETLMGSMFDDTDDKVIFKNIKPTRKEILSFQIPKKLVPGAVSHNGDDIDLDDDFRDPPQRQKQLTTKKISSKEKAKGKESDQPPTDENVKNTSPYHATPKFIHEFNKNPEGTLNTKPIDESISEAQISESQFTFSDENRKFAIEMNVNKPTEDESEVNDVDKSKLDQQHKTPVHIPDGVNDESNVDQDLPDSQFTLPDELLPSLNTYVNLE
ncbi:hypothetical protein FXO38_23647 [Capsicum annuum]|nr:hypothetical protein FXO38_23647 [Capsicum annuum]